MSNEENKYGASVIGSGSFGLTISNLLAINTNVLLLSRSEDAVEQINRNHSYKGVKLQENIRATLSFEEIAKETNTIFPMVPSSSFSAMMDKLSDFLSPKHAIIHGTKGFDIITGNRQNGGSPSLNRQEIRTMSEVIMQKSVVVRVGCMAGPNLAREIQVGQPTATLIASQFDEVIEVGKKLLSSDKFYVFGSYDIIGAEIAGSLKNMIALGTGMLHGLGYGKNIQAVLITKGLHEMIFFGKAMNANIGPFLGTAGIGDLIATATSEDSRNFRFGMQLAQGIPQKEIEENIGEVAEGVRTLKIAYNLARQYKLQVPICNMLYRIAYEDLNISKAISQLMRYPFMTDVSF